MMRVIATAVLVGALAFTPLASAGEDASPDADEAAYEGRPASAWVADLSAADVAKRRKAAYAVWNLGDLAQGAAVPLARALLDDDAYVRSTSGKALEKLGDAAAPAVGLVAKALANDDPEVAREAARVLYRLGALASGVVPQLEEALGSTDAKTRAFAAAALGNAGAEARPALPALERVVAEESDAEARNFAVATIARIDAARGLGLKDRDLLLVAAKSLANLPPVARDDAQISALLAALAEPDDEIRAFVAAALGTALIAKTSRATEAGSKRAIPALLRALAEDTSGQVRFHAAFGLGRYMERADEVVPGLVAGCGAEDTEARTGCLYVIKWFGEKARAVVPHALAALSADDPQLRQAALGTLAACGQDDLDRVLPVLTKALDDPQWRVSRGAGDALASLGPAAAPALPAMLAFLQSDANPIARTGVVQAIGRLGPEAGKAAVPALTEIFESAPDERRSLSVCEALCRLGAPAAPRALDRIARWLEDRGAALPAAQILAQLGPQAAPAVPRLVAALDTADPDTRLNVLRVLEQIGPAARDAIPAVERLLRHVDRPTREAAASALTKLNP